MYMMTMKRIIFPLFWLICYARGEIDKEVTCCPPGYHVMTKTSSCKEVNTNTTTSLRVNCAKTFVMEKYTLTAENLLELQLSESYSETLEPDKFCIGNKTSVKDPSKWRLVALLCLYDEAEEIIPDEVLGYCMIVSAVFLTLTTIIYCALSELRDLQGKSIINFCGSLAIGLSILAMMKLIEYEDMDLCAARGFFTYFFLIAAFFWSNAISIQVFISMRKSISVDRGWKEFLWYALFAWGCSAVLTICMAIVNYHPGNHRRPGIGLNHCWFIDKKQQWIYFYSVMSIIIAINIMIFIYTSTIVWRHSFSSSHVKALKYKMIMTIRLIILMGLPWIFEMISSLFDRHIMWTILDLFNTLQGFLIFLLLVVFRKRTVKAMHRRGWLDCISGAVEKYLAVGDDDEEDAIQHTDLPMNG